jgi:GT2 family glycosyltransferase
MIDGLTIVVPYRGDVTGQRARNAGIVLEHYAEVCSELILVEHDSAHDRALALPRGVRHVHVPSDGPFNKSAACNRGYAETRTPLIGLVDADMLIKASTLESCARIVARTGSVVRPYGLLRSIASTELELSEVNALLQPIDIEQSTDERDGERIPFCGGIVLMHASTFESVGGMDDRFVGWGGEDDALSAALVRTGTPCRILRSQVALHLEHSRDSMTRYGHAHYSANRARAAWWWHAPEQLVMAQIAAGRSRLRRSGHAAGGEKE